MKLLNAKKLLLIVLSLKCKTMSSYCFKFLKKDTESINPRVLETINDKAMLLSKCAICGSEKFKLIKKTRSKWNIKQSRF